MKFVVNCVLYWFKKLKKKKTQDLELNNTEKLTMRETIL